MPRPRLAAHLPLFAPPPLRRTLAITALLFAWLCANGGLFAAAQVFAWGTRFARNARALPLRAALRAPFDPAKPREFCLGGVAATETARPQLPSSVEHTSTEKIVLALHWSARPFFRSPPADWPLTLPASVAIITRAMTQLRGLHPAVEAVHTAVGMTGGTNSSPSPPTPPTTPRPS